ncbi:MAG: lytic murein transglycosylase [Stappiaceae bacterium]
MRPFHHPISAIFIALPILFTSTAIAQSKTCGNSAAGFEVWVEDFKGAAASRGISRKTANTALSGLRYDKRVIRLDRNQKKTFNKSFKSFASTRVTSAAIKRGKSKMRTHAKTFAAVEKRYGVPAPVIAAIWGLETNYGGFSGNMSVFRSLATLAYDCRRADFFRNELLAALHIVDRGDMTPKSMVGAWAGEIGQTQFLATSYVKYAVDFDGNGRRDLVRSVPDVLGSTGNYLRAFGWKRGGSWQAGSRNFAVLKKWNKSDNYQRTIALMADKLAN